MQEAPILAADPPAPQVAEAGAPYAAPVAVAPTPVVPAPAPVPPAPAAPRRSRTPVRETRVSGQPAFVLHSYPYKETSLIVDLFTRDHGRIAVVAKGAKRPLSKLRGVLQTFQPLSVSWSGKSELRTLIDAEWVGGMLPLERTALLCGFYLNELLVKLLARDDAHRVLFDHYVSTLNELAHDEPAQIVLRKFERALLKETGVAADLARSTTTREPVAADASYVVDPERGAREARVSDVWPVVSGKTLLDMEREDYADPATQAQSKQLMRFLLAHHLGGAPLNTRQILIDLMQL
ncbi:DNA repair protein RecO [Massilia sp.]|uniref:DNA repair protein RecO n=1 Tax=Massilia sp. TaxID=1882437 RepID=UPI0028B0DD26|nr:DNA repair protein RecO [Massilia sp.]